jgi:protein MpaA
LLERIAVAPWREIGRSREGRPIVVAAWGEGPVALVVGAVHGDEPASALAAYRLACAYPESPGRVLVIPALNPDGLARHAKDNTRGVDLNRNFPTRNFGEAPRPGYDPGPSAGSEPETQALLSLLAAQAPSRVVAIHQPFACVNYDGPAQAWAEAVGRAAALPVRSDIGYPTPGSLGTYLGVERGIPILTLELGTGEPDVEWPRAEAALLAALRFVGS